MKKVFWQKWKVSNILLHVQLVSPLPLTISQYSAFWPKIYWLTLFQRSYVAKEDCAHLAGMILVWMVLHSRFNLALVYLSLFTYSLTTIFHCRIFASVASVIFNTASFGLSSDNIFRLQNYWRNILQTLSQSLLRFNLWSLQNMKQDIKNSCKWKQYLCTDMTLLWENGLVWNLL